MENRFSEEQVLLVEDVIRTRRSVKPADFSDRQVEQATIRRLLESANWAPTHGLTEPWRFAVFTGDGRKQLVAVLEKICCQLFPAGESRTAKLEKLRQNLQRAPCVIAIVMRRQPAAKIPEVEEVAAVACAVQNLHLVATAMGLAGYWSSGELICNPSLLEYLGFQEPDRVLGLFYLGYPGKSLPQGKRTPVDEKISWRDQGEV